MSATSGSGRPLLLLLHAPGRSRSRRLPLLETPPCAPCSENEPPLRRSFLAAGGADAAGCLAACGPVLGAAASSRGMRATGSPSPGLLSDASSCSLSAEVSLAPAADTALTDDRSGHAGPIQVRSVAASGLLVAEDAACCSAVSACGQAIGRLDAEAGAACGAGAGTGASSRLSILPAPTSCSKECTCMSTRHRRWMQHNAAQKTAPACTYFRRSEGRKEVLTSSSCQRGRPSSTCCTSASSAGALAASRAPLRSDTRRLDPRTRLYRRT